MGLVQDLKGLWDVICDQCGRRFELDEAFDLTPYKDHTIRLARARGWKIGASCSICRSCKLRQPRRGSH